MQLMFSMQTVLSHACITVSVQRIFPDINTAINLDCTVITSFFDECGQTELQSGAFVSISHLFKDHSFNISCF